MSYRIGIEVGLEATSWAVIDRTGHGERVTEGSFPSVVGSAERFVSRLGEAEPLIVDGTPYGVEALVGRLVEHAITTGRPAGAGDPGGVVLVHPDDMDPYRTGLLAEAVRLAGVPADRRALVAHRAAIADGASAATGAAMLGWQLFPDDPARRSPAAPLIAGAAAGGAAAAAAVAADAARATTAAPTAGPMGTPLGAPTAGPPGTPLAGPAGGPSGTPLAPTAGPSGTPLGAPTAGPPGTPLPGPAAGPSGTPLAPMAGPSGTPLAGPAAGPTGTPLAPAAGPIGAPLGVNGAKRSIGLGGRAGWIAGGAAAVAALVVVVAVVLGGGDDSAGSGTDADAAAVTTAADIDDSASATPTSVGATDAPSPVTDASAPATVAEAVTTVVAGYDFSAVAGDWVGVCEPFGGNTGASNNTFTLTPTGPDSIDLVIEGFDYSTSDCTGAGTSLITVTYALTAVGTTTIDGVTVVKVVDSSGQPEVIGVDGSGQLRFGSPTGPFDGDGFATVLQPAADNSGTRG